MSDVPQILQVSAKFLACHNIFLYFFMYYIEPSETLRRPLRHPDPTPPPVDLRTAVQWIAQLGGFLGRCGDGDPGVKPSGGVIAGWRI